MAAGIDFGIDVNFVRKAILDTDVVFVRNAILGTDAIRAYSLRQSVSDSLLFYELFVIQDLACFIFSDKHIETSRKIA